jgi:mono/diheme cytochrome c family protein
MKKVFFILLAGIALIAGAAWLLSAPRPLYAAQDWQAFEAGGDAEAGRLVFNAGGCESCHAIPGQPDLLRLGGGLELKTPFGSFYPPNISPDPKDGIGGWKVVDLANALMAGVSPQGQHYYPAFPYASYQRMTLADVRNLMAFLRTLPAVQGRPPAHALAFPFSIRRAVGFWKFLYLDGAKLSPDPSRSAEWNLGRYLVEGPGHCAECHSPRDFLGGIVASRRFAGGATPDGKGRAPNLTGTGLANWTKADIVEALASGLTPDGDSLGGSMAAVVRNTAQLPPNYREAMAEYLKSLAPIERQAALGKPDRGL